jgi:hypothetical protein
MLLPSGQVLFSASSSNVQVYTPDSEPQDGWRPTISSITPHGSLGADYYLLQGTQLNGLSQANTYGDDCSPATNYPLVQLTDISTNRIHYCRTYDFSTMGVDTGRTLQSCRFTPGKLVDGVYDLRVVANGIASHPVGYTYKYSGLAVADNRAPTDSGQRKPLFHEAASEGAVSDPTRRDVEELQVKLRDLENSVKRLEDLVQTLAPPAAGEGTAKRADVTQIAKDRG